MKLIFFAFLFSLFLLQDAAAATSACQKVKPFVTDIRIEMLTPPPVYDLTKDLKFLNSDNGKSAEEWLKKNGVSSIWRSKDMETQGTAAGGWGAFTKYQLDAEPLDPYGAYGCVYFKKIEVNMMFRTLIMIPKEFPKESCFYNIINEHELKHYDVNQEIANEIADRLRKDIPEIIEQLESVHVGTDKIEGRTAEMQTAFNEMIDVYFQQVMLGQMKKRNELIDSPEEYKRLSINKRACDEGK